MKSSIVQKAQKYKVILAEKAQKHGVKPKIFIIIFLLSFIPYYGGIIIASKGLIAGDIRLTILGLLTNRVAWASPYLYVEIWGKNLRWYIHFLVWVYILGFGIYFILRYLSFL